MLALTLACGDGVDGPATGGLGLSPTAKPEITEALRLDLTMPRDPSDGGGRAWIEEPIATGVVGASGNWTFGYEAGDLGIAAGGWIFLQAPPFWGWSTPQVVSPEGFGFTTVRTSAGGVELEAATVDQQLLGIQIKGRALKPGEQIQIDYGAGPLGAIADRYAEAQSCFYLAVDGDGDGVRSLVRDRLCVEVTSGPATQLVLTLPSTAQPGSSRELVVAVLDAGGNRCRDWAGEIELSSGGDLQIPRAVTLSPEDEGSRRVEFSIGEPGLYRISASTSQGLSVRSNPLWVDAAAPGIFWGDLHGHSALSDGTGTPRDYYRYARDVAALDIVALTDHDHWGMEPLSIHPELWEEIRRETELFHQPGEFVTLLGYEWTSWLHGHRHVLYFEATGQVLSSVDQEYESPLQLWQALRGIPALTFAHHSAGGPVATNWQIAPDPELEPVTEIVSVHGSSEASDSPGRIYSAVEGNFVRDVLNRGYQLGFIGSGDSHDGHPGLAHLNGATGGLAAIIVDELSRQSVRQALQARRVYATSGQRIILDVDLAGVSMGGSVEASRLAQAAEHDRLLGIRVHAVEPLDRIEVVLGQDLIALEGCADTVSCSEDFALPSLSPGDFLYVRVVQRDGAAAWSSPVFVH